VFETPLVNDEVVGNGLELWSQGRGVAESPVIAEIGTLWLKLVHPRTLIVDLRIAKPLARRAVLALAFAGRTRDAHADQAHVAVEAHFANLADDPRSVVLAFKRTG